MRDQTGSGTIFKTRKTDKLPTIVPQAKHFVIMGVCSVTLTLTFELELLRYAQE